MGPSITDTIYTTINGEQAHYAMYKNKKSFDYIYTLHIGILVYLLSCLVSFKQDKSDFE